MSPEYKLFVLILLLFCALSSIAQEPITTAIMEDYDGEQYILSEVLDEKRHVINIYADWCGWCKVEWTAWAECIDDVKSEYDLEFLVLGTNKNVPEDDSKDVLQSSLGSYIDLEKIRLFYINQDTLINRHEIIAFPTSYIIDEMGNIMDTLKGFHDCEELFEELDEAFESTTSFSNLPSRTLPLIYYSDYRLIIEPNMNKEYELDIFNVLGQKLRSFQHVMGNTQFSLNEIANETIIVVLSRNHKILKTQQLSINH